MYTVDEQLVVTGRSYLSTMIQVFSTIFVIIAVTPWFLVGLVPIIIFYLHQQEFFTMTYRELKRVSAYVDEQWNDFSQYIFYSNIDFTSSPTA